MDTFCLLQLSTSFVFPPATSHVEVGRKDVGHYRADSPSSVRDSELSCFADKLRLQRQIVLPLQAELVQLADLLIICDLGGGMLGPVELDARGESFAICERSVLLHGVIQRSRRNSPGTPEIHSKSLNRRCP